MITNRDLQNFGRDAEEKEMADKAIFLLNRIRTIEQDIKAKNQIITQLRSEYDSLQERRKLKNQTRLF